MVQARSVFKKAVISGRKLRASVQGPSGTGKTTTMMRVSKGICEREGGRFCVIDSEDGRALLEATRFDFDHCDLRDLCPGDREITPDAYLEALAAAAEAKYTVVLVDSLSHEWEAILRMKDDLPAKEQFTGWKKVNPHHAAVFRAILEHPAHIIVSLRSRMEHVIDEQTKEVRKLGMSPVMRERSEYEFDLAFELDMDSKCTLAKRPRGIFHALDRYSKREPGEELGHLISDALRGLNEEAAKAAAANPPSPGPKTWTAVNEEKVALASDLNALATFAGGRDALLRAIGWKAWPQNLGEARECLRLAKAAHEAALSFDAGPEDPDSIPFDEGAAQPSEPISQATPPGGTAPPPTPAPPLKVVPSTSEAQEPGPDANQSPDSAQSKPGDGGKQATTNAARKKAVASFVPLKDLWPTLQRLGISKEDLAIDLELYGKHELARLTQEERDHYLEQVRIRALPKVEALRQELGMQREELEGICQSFFEVTDFRRLGARDLAELLRHLGLSLTSRATATTGEIVKEASADVPM